MDAKKSCFSFEKAAHEGFTSNKIFISDKSQNVKKKKFLNRLVTEFPEFDIKL